MESSDPCKLGGRWSLKVTIGTRWLKETGENSWEGKRLNIDEKRRREDEIFFKS